MLEEVKFPLKSGSIKNKLSLLANFAGAFCTLVGLIEIIRLISTYWQTYGLLANFSLEITIYLVGLAWTVGALLKFVGSSEALEPSGVSK